MLPGYIHHTYHDDLTMVAHGAAVRHDGLSIQLLPVLPLSQSLK